jgi:hypothetical protein
MKPGGQPVLLYVVTGIAAVALLALGVAIVSGSVFVGWLTVGISAAGLLLLIVNELRHRVKDDAEEDVDTPEAVTASADPGIAPEPAHDEHDHDEHDHGQYDQEALRPDIWPPDHPVHETSSDGDEDQPRRAGDPPRPDIWP